MNTSCPVRLCLLSTALCVLLVAQWTFAQSTGFLYQGKLNDAGNAANGVYDLQVRLYDALSAGSQIGSTVTLDDVTVSGGVFSVTVDFGSSSFPGADRWVEVSVRPGASTGTYTALSPRQPVAAAPYAVQSLKATTATNANQLGGVASSQYVLTGDSRLTDSRAPTAGSSSYIQNSSSTQSSSNFNISGNGTAGGTLTAATVNATGQYSLNGSRILSAGGTLNLFAGALSGSLTSGSNNAFFGMLAGSSNTSGSNNAFFGEDAGSNNSTGGSDTFIGLLAGQSNTSGSNNTAVGARADLASSGLSYATAIGADSVVTTSNTIVLGRAAAQDQVNVPGTLAVSTMGSAGATALCRNASNQVGTCASTYVTSTDSRLTDARAPTAGSSNYVQNTTSQQSSSNFNISGNGTAGGTLSANIVNSTTQYNINGSRAFSVDGAANVFAGLSAGVSNSGSYNTFVGDGAGQANTIGNLNSFFGSGAGNANTTATHNSFFGNIAGNSTTGGSNSFFGSQAGTSTTTGSNNAFFGKDAGDVNQTGSQNTMVGYAAGDTNHAGSNLTLIGANSDVSLDGFNYATAIGAGAVALASNTIVLGRAAGQEQVQIPGTLKVSTLGSAGSTALCQNASSQIATCSSSIRYKSDIRPWDAGLTLVNKLRPVSFTWKESQVNDVGLVAEEVASVAPLLVTTNGKGEVEGVKYDRVGVVLLNAVNEQQAMIESLGLTVRDQQQQIEAQRQMLDSLRLMLCAERGVVASVCGSR